MMIGLVMPKIQPAVQTLIFTLGEEGQGANPIGDDYIDLSQAVSIANRRAYRQGLHWSIGSIKIMTFGNTGALLTQKINETWVTSNAWEKAFRLWHKMNRQVLDVNPGLKPKYYDFKVGFDADHNFSNNKLPIGANLNVATAGEWVQSTIQIPYDSATGATKEYSLHMVGGDTATHKGCIVGYAESRALIDASEPSLPGGYSTNWMNNLFDTGENHEELAQDLEADNDQTPYPQSPHPGGGIQLVGEVHDYSYISNTTVGATTYIKGGTFPCGLVKFTRQFDADPGNDYRYTVQIDLIPGKLRGYLAEPMTKM